MRSNARSTAWASLFCTTALILATHSGAIVGALLAIGAAGLTTSALLDKFDAKLRGLIDKATQDGGLLTSKAARDALLLVGAAREQLHDELDTQWEKLDAEKISVLQTIDMQTDKIGKAIEKTEKLEDTIYLDIDHLLSSIPFLKNSASIRRVDGGTQYYKGPAGLYRLVMTGNFFAVGTNFTAALNGIPLNQASLVPQPPYKMAVSLTASVVNAHFRDQNLGKDRGIAALPLKICGEVPNRTYSFQFWRTELRSACFDVVVQLLPKNPVEYRLVQYRHVRVVDRSKVEVAPGADQFIPGCGDSGCWTRHDICTAVPPGTEKIGPHEPPVVTGPAGYYAWLEYRDTPSGYCRIFAQNSHNQSRNVHFDVDYHPLRDDAIRVPTDLTALTLPNDDAANNKAADNISRASAGADAPNVACSSISFFGIFTASSCGPFAKKQSGTGFLQYGKTYSAMLDADMQSFDLVLHTFTGDEYVVTPATMPSCCFRVAPLERVRSFQRFTITPIAPWSDP
jgi:hypothetical protein